MRANLTIATFVLTLALAPDLAHAQTSVRANYVEGQVFIVWDVATVSPPMAYVIYARATPTMQVSNATRLGACFEPEWEGERLKIANAAYRWRIPAGGPFADNTGLGQYEIAANEGLFVVTAHVAGAVYLAVAPDTATTFAMGNWTAAAVSFTYDPVGDPVTCHLQREDIDNGRVRKIYALWADGSLDENSGRPDFPIMANAAKNGAPSVFAITEGPNLPARPMHAVFTLHGGDGTFSQMTNAGPAYENIGLTLDDGVVVSHDDAVYVRDTGGTPARVSSNWVGYSRTMNPFLALVIPQPTGSIIVPYTMVRVKWITEWVIAHSGYMIDSHRVSLVGFSVGAEGCYQHARLYPELYSAAVACGCPMDVGGPLIGTASQNLEMSIIGPAGTPLHVGDLPRPGIRISATQRDYPIMRIYIGRNETSQPWTLERISNFIEANDAGWGIAVHWDRRDHGVSSWNTNEDGFPSTDCQYDVGEWIVPPSPIAPGRTQRTSASYLGRYRNDQSYPGFFNDDQDSLTPGRQPDIGDGTQCDGDWWGTWAGYCDWDQATIIDAIDQWECTLFLTGLSSTAVDNALTTLATADVSIRRPQQFNPAVGTPLDWTLIDAASLAVLQSGSVTPASDGLIIVTGLLIPRDPNRVRLRVAVPLCPADITPLPNGNGFVNVDDLLAVINAWGPCANPNDCPADIAPPGGNDFVNVDDLLAVINAWGACR